MTNGCDWASCEWVNHGECVCRSRAACKSSVCKIDISVKLKILTLNDPRQDAPGGIEEFSEKMVVLGSFLSFLLDLF